MKKIWFEQDSGARLCRKLFCRGLFARNQGSKHNYIYKLEVYNVKEQGWTEGHRNKGVQGPKQKRQDLYVRVLYRWEDRHVILESAGTFVQNGVEDLG
jgi:hypothetical protein